MSTGQDGPATARTGTGSSLAVVLRAWCGEPKTSAQANRHDALPCRMNMRTSRDHCRRFGGGGGDKIKGVNHHE